MKKHIDCDWLIEKSEGVYMCCDTRSPNKGKELTFEDIHLEACSFFHPKKTKTEISFFDDLQPSPMPE